MDRDDAGAVDSVVFTYGAPLVGVLLVAVGIAAAVPGAYALVQADLTSCGDPTIAVEDPAETRRHFGDAPRPDVGRVPVEALSPAERRAFRAALDDPRGEAHVRGPAPNYPAFRNGTFVVAEGQRHYVTVVAENTCFRAAPLQFPLGVFAIAFGVVGILTPPLYRKLVALEAGAGPG